VTFASLAGPDIGAAVPMVAQPSSPPRPEDPGGRGEDFGKSSPLGFLVLILFFVAVAFLIRSMNKHLRRVPASFDKPDVPDTDTGAEPPASVKPNGKPEPA
jgi:hypothetical protein